MCLFTSININGIRERPAVGFDSKREVSLGLGFSKPRLLDVSTVRDDVSLQLLVVSSLSSLVLQP